MANTIQIKHSPNDVTPSAASVDLAKGELAWVDHGTGGANGKLYIGDATAAGAVQRHIGGVGTGAVAAAAAAGSLTGTTMASNVVTSSLTTVGTIGSGTWEATDVAVSHGGTGASSASSARTNLGVAIGSDVQAYHANLAAVAGSTYAGDDAIVTVGSIATGTWAATDVAVSHGGTGASSASSARTNLGLAIGSDVQAYDAQLDTLAGASSTNATAVTNLTGTNSGDEPDASATVKGIVELATTSETTTGTDTARAVTPAGVQAAIDALIDSAPGALDTLNELAAAIGDDASYATTVTNALAAKSPIASPTFTGTVAIPNIADLESAVTANTAKSTNVSTNLGVSASGSAFTITSSDGTNASLTLADTDNWGVMSDEMFDKLDGIETSATADQTKSDINGLAITTVGAIDSGSWTATDVAVAHGGTGASSASGARTNLGLAIGSDVQAYDAQLAALAGVSSTNTTAVGNLTGTNSGDEVAATASVAGVIELATDAETITGSATNRAITPANLAAATITGGTF